MKIVNGLGVLDENGSIVIEIDPAPEIEHPVFRSGEWVNDPSAYTRVVAPTLPSSIAEYDAALTAHLDSVAQSRRYADRISCSVRAGYVGPFQAEGIAFATWMDTCNATGYQMLDDYQNGLIPQPTIAEMLAALPPMVWPS